MIIITPDQFKKAFLNVVVNEEAQLANFWVDPRYTDFMLRTLLPRIAVDLNLKVYTKDYYLMDSVFYQEMHQINFPLNQKYIKYIAIAFEHEHHANGSKAEIHRLQFYNTPLKVLVTYPTRNFNDTLLLNIYSEIIQQADIFSDFSTLRKQLVIFGYLWLSLWKSEVKVGFSCV